MTVRAAILAALAPYAHTMSLAYAGAAAIGISILVVALGMSIDARTPQRSEPTVVAASELSARQLPIGTRDASTAAPLASRSLQSSGVLRPTSTPLATVVAPEPEEQLDGRLVAASSRLGAVAEPGPPAAPPTANPPTVESVPVSTVNVPSDVPQFADQAILPEASPTAAAVPTRITSNRALATGRSGSSSSGAVAAAPPTAVVETAGVTAPSADAEADDDSAQSRDHGQSRGSQSDAASSTRGDAGTRPASGGDQAAAPGNSGSASAGPQAAMSQTGSPQASSPQPSKQANGSNGQNPQNFGQAASSSTQSRSKGGGDHSSSPSSGSGPRQGAAPASSSGSSKAGGRGK